MLRAAIPAFILRFASGLRFPALFGIIAALFLLDLAVPDLVPFYDEIVLGFATLLLASLRRRRE